MQWADVRSRIEGYIPWLIMSLGILLRLRQYLADRSLWLDEALLARAVVERSFIGLVHPLGYGENAPVGFLEVSKLATVVGGATSLALRFFPLLFGIVALVLFYRVARYFLQPAGTFIALTLFSFASGVVYYSTEYKPYMADVLVTVVLWYFFLVARPKKKIWFALIGMVVIWFSHSSVFILAGLGLSDLALWTYAVPCWLASFGLDYFLTLRYALVPSVIQEWHGHFLTFPWQGGGGGVFLETVVRTFGYFIDLDRPWIQAPVLLFV